MRPTPHRPSGFTLIELVIVVAVIGVLAAATVPSIQAVTGANARAAAGELAGTMRYLFETAALRHQTCRLAIDIDNRTWWAECTKDRFTISGEKTTAARPEEDDEELADRFADERDADRRRLLARARFTQFSDRLARRRELPGSARFEAVWSEHQREPFSRGVAHVYFFAPGRAEEARVPVVDGDHTYTVVVQPFTGRARVVNGLVGAPRS